MGESRLKERALEPAFGVYPAIVGNVVDPDGLGRVEVTLPKTVPGGGGARAWARLAPVAAGKGSGTWFVPSVGDEVLVCFEAGDTTRPYVLGSLWNRGNPPPESMDRAGANGRRSIRSPGGITVSLDDRNGSATVVLETPGGQRVTLADAPATVEIEDANGNSIVLGPAGITVSASAKVTVQANTAAITVSQLQVDSGMSEFTGVVKCDALITKSVVSESYTPGAGNVS